jgi:hypothetical protein
MPSVLTTSSTVQCSHQAKVALQSSQTKLKAGGSPVLLQTDMIGASISGCPNSGPSLTPCSSTVSVTAGMATNLSVDSTPVLLESATGLTNSVPPGTWTVTSAGQSVLSAS